MPTPFTDSRHKPWASGAQVPAAKSETLTVAEFTRFPGYYGIVLSESPVPGSLTITGYTEIETGLPTAGTFLADYEGTGLVLFHSSANAASVSASYDGKGSILHRSNLRGLIVEVLTELGLYPP